MLAEKLLPLFLPIALGAQQAPPALAMTVFDEVRLATFQIDYKPQEGSPFFAAVLVSLSPTLTNYFVGLPPLLTDFAVLGLGIGNDTFRLDVSFETFPPGILIYGQGVVADGSMVLSTQVEGLILNGLTP